MPFLRQNNGNKQEETQINYEVSEVYFVPETGQIFEDYEKYINSLVQKNQPIWSCKYTGKNGMTFWEALASEKKAQEMLDSFPECWKGPLLRLVQHSIHFIE